MVDDLKSELAHDLESEENDWVEKGRKYEKETVSSLLHPESKRSEVNGREREARTSTAGSQNGIRGEKKISGDKKSGAAREDKAKVSTFVKAPPNWSSLILLGGHCQEMKPPGFVTEKSSRAQA